MISARAALRSSTWITDPASSCRSSRRCQPSRCRPPQCLRCHLSPRYRRYLDRRCAALGCSKFAHKRRTARRPTFRGQLAWASVWKRRSLDHSTQQTSRSDQLRRWRLVVGDRVAVEGAPELLVEKMARAHVTERGGHARAKLWVVALELGEQA